MRPKLEESLQGRLPGPRCRRKIHFALYHWAPASRRDSIRRLGLMPGKKHVTHSSGWQADYLCFSDCPEFAWACSGNLLPPRTWDLWRVWSYDIPDLCYRGDHVGCSPAEYRTRHNIDAKALWLVATRSPSIIVATTTGGPRNRHA